MNDPIDRQAAIDHWRLIIDATSMDSRYDMGFVDGLEFCINHLSTMPAAQPEIIRCKDCKWCEDADGLMCKNPASWVVATDRDFGCVLAERRTDEPK